MNVDRDLNTKVKHFTCDLSEMRPEGAIKVADDGVVTAGAQSNVAADGVVTAGAQSNVAADEILHERERRVPDERRVRDKRRVHRSKIALLQEHALEHHCPVAGTRPRTSLPCCRNTP